MKKLLKKFNLEGDNTFWLVLLGFFALLNIVGALFFFRVDITEQRIFSLSDSSKNTIAQLDDLIRVKVFVSKDLPSEMFQSLQYLKDLLAEYQAAASSQVMVHYVDPKDDSELTSEAQRLGIPEVQMNIVKEDKYAVQNGYFGLSLQYLDQKEVIPFLGKINNLEYEITSRLLKLGRSTPAKVTFLQGRGEHLITNGFGGGDPRNSDYNIVKSELEKNYPVDTVDLRNGSAVPVTDLLVIAGSKEVYTEREKYEIDQYLMRGGKIIWLYDAIDLVNGSIPVANDIGVSGLLAHYGLKVPTEIVLDHFNEIVPFNAGNTQYILPYPMWPKIQANNVNADHPLSANFKGLVFPWAAPIELAKSADSLISLVKTSDKSWVQTSENWKLDPQQEWRLTMTSEIKQRSLAVLSSGPFTSFYQGKEVPEVLLAEGSDLVADVSERTSVDASPAESSILLISEADFLSDNMVRRFQANALFFFNAVDYLALGEGISGIRSQSLQDRPFIELDPRLKTVLKYVLSFSGILVLLIYAGVRWFYRRAISK